MKLSSIFLKSVNDTLSWSIVKLALVVGIALAFIWIGFGNLFWDSVFSLSSHFISWIPFSILKSNAAFLIGGFVWFLVVLATYAIIIALFNVPISKMISPKKYEAFSVVLLILISIGWTLFAIENWDLVYKELAKLLTWFPFQTLQDGVAWLLSMLVFYNLYIVSMYIVVMIFNKPFLKIIALRDYGIEYETNSIETSRFIKTVCKDLSIFFIFLILSFPLFFVPFVNILIQLVLWTWFIKESYFLSAASTYATKEEIESLSELGSIKWLIAFLGSFLNLLPIVNIFAPFFTQTMFFHWVMQNRK